MLSNLTPTYETTTFSYVGDAVIATRTPVVSQVTKILYGDHGYGDDILAIPWFPNLFRPRVPQTKGKVSPAGITDLLVVKQQLKGYEAADLAHIENVLKGENKVHENSNTRRTEEVVFTETEKTSSEENESGSTTRFEMSQETSNTIKDDQSLKAGLQVCQTHTHCS